MRRGAGTNSESIGGLLVVDKPAGLSSMDVVRHVRRAAGGVKTGHTGTLDPLATGVVVCALGRATRCVETVMGLTKVYEACIDLSATSLTDDLEGPLETVEVTHRPTEAQVRAALAQFVGAIEQRPPAYSAVHVNGQRAYKLARRGQAVDLAARTVHVKAIELRQYAWPAASVSVICGRGTYIRSLARDLGVHLGTGGYLSALRRTAVGPYDLAAAVTIDRLPQPITQTDLLPAPGPATSHPMGQRSNDQVE